MNIFRTWSFKWWEVGLIKLCLASLGIIIGIYCYDYVKNLTWVWWTIFDITAFYFILKFFREIKQQ